MEIRIFHSGLIGYVDHTLDPSVRPQGWDISNFVVFNVLMVPEFKAPQNSVIAARFETPACSMQFASTAKAAQRRTRNVVPL